MIFTFNCADCGTEWSAGNKRKCNDGKHRCTPCNGTRNDLIKSKRRSTDPNYKAYMRAYSTGVLPEEFNKKLVEQNGLCAICSCILANSPKGPQADHCHNTDKFRGILCRNHNVGLGMFSHDINLLQKAIDYLRGTNGTA